MTITPNTPPADWPAVMTTLEVATVLRVSKGVVYQLAADGTLPSIRFGRLLRFSRDAIAVHIGARVEAAVNR